MEQVDKNQKSADEIDITQFFKWIGRGFHRFGSAVLYGLATLRNLFFNNRLFFAGIILLGLLLGALYSELLKKKFYKTTMVLSCDYLNTQILENTIEKFNLLCGESEREGLASILKIDVNIANNIQGFEFNPFVSEDDVVEMEVLRTQLTNLGTEKKDIVDKIINKLIITNKNAYQISVFVYSPEIVKPLEKALLSYFGNSDYIKNRITINRRNLETRKVKLIRESEKLDSLKSVLYKNFETMSKQQNRGSNNVILGDENLVNPLQVFDKDLDLNEEIISIEKELSLSSDFELIDGFTSFKQPESASLIKILFIAFWISLLMGYLIIGAWRFDRMLANYPTK